MTDTKSIEVVVITPERQLLKEQADAVVIPAHDGELGVLHDRAALMCELGIGQMRYTRGGQTRRVFIDGGFGQVFDNHVTLLTANATRGEDVDAETVAIAHRAVEQHQGTDATTLEARAKAQRRLSVLRGMLASR